MQLALHHLDAPDYPPTPIGFHIAHRHGRITWHQGPTTCHDTGTDLYLCHGRRRLAHHQQAATTREAADIVHREAAAIAPWAETIHTLDPIPTLRTARDDIRAHHTLLRDDFHEPDPATLEALTPLLTDPDHQAATGTGTTYWLTAARAAIDRLNADIRQLLLTAYAHTPRHEAPPTRFWHRPNLRAGDFHTGEEPLATALAHELTHAWGLMYTDRERLITWADTTPLPKTHISENTHLSRGTIDRILKIERLPSAE